MKAKQIYIFDLFDTILKVKQTNFKSGLYLFWEKYFSHVCTFSKMESYSEDLFYTMKELQNKNHEFSFVYDFIPKTCNKFGIQPFSITLQEESKIISAISQCIVSPETLCILEQLNKKCIPTFILSNSIFRSGALNEFIKQYNIHLYFENVFSSADFGIRKPDYRLFDICINEINKKIFVKKSNIIFIGNSYPCDAVGGYNFGLKTIWLNAAMTENKDKLPIEIITSMAEININEYEKN